MPSGSPAKSRVFTVEQANAALPLVRMITEDLTSLARSVHDRRRRVAHLSASRDLSDRNPYSEELAHVESQLAKDEAQIGEYLEELREIGVESKGVLEGLVDFPAMRDGRMVYLCWKIGETKVTHWHELDGGFSGRKQIESLNASPISGQSS